MKLVKLFFHEIFFDFNIETNALILAVTKSNVQIVDLLLSHQYIDVNCKYVKKKISFFYRFNTPL